MDDYELESKKGKSFFKSHKVLYLVFLLSFVVIALYSVFRPPTETLGIVNKQGITVHITKGESLDELVKEAKDKKLVRSSTALKILVTFFGGSHKIQKGDYLFKESAFLPSVAWRFASGKHGVEPLKVTLKEGLTNEEMSEILATRISVFRKDIFLSESKQGYLFPDTYFFFPMTTTDEILEELTNNFKKRINSLSKDISKSGRSLDDIITMASIIEKEAKGEEDAPLISGILWKRLEKGMPLQVDADKSTYKNIGLPSTPISNPGLVSIKASLYPVDSVYLYYLHDKEGKIHFAENYNKHKLNIDKYLR